MPEVAYALHMVPSMNLNRPCTCSIENACCRAPHPIHLDGLRHPELRDELTAARQRHLDLAAYRTHRRTGDPIGEILVVGGEQIERPWIG